MKLNSEQVNIVKDILHSFIFKIRIPSVLNFVYKYYISDNSQLNEGNRVKIDLDFKSIKLQINRNILSQRNNYWNLNDSGISLLEQNQYILDELKEYIETLLESDLEKQLKEIEKREQEEENKEDEKLLSILSPKEILLPIVKKILKDSREYPYKSDKIKILLAVHLNVDQIYAILANYEKFAATRSYIDKYRQERVDLISEGKLKNIPLEDMIKILK